MVYRLCLLLVLLTLPACQKNEMKTSYSAINDETAFSEEKMDKASSYGLTDSTSSPEAEKKENPVKNRKLIKNGQIEYVVEDLAKVEPKIQDKLNEYQGYIESAESGASYAVYVVKIPSDRFEAFLKISGDLGKISSRNIHAEDVTRQFFDLEQRIKTRRILLDKYQSYLRGAKTVEELLKSKRRSTK